MALQLRSSAFRNGEAIPRTYSCDGENSSPPLSWEGVPDGTAAQVLLVTDPDAPRGTFTHWVLYNIPPEVRQLPERLSPRHEAMKDGSRQGLNDFDQLGYGGPCPPPGKSHRYFFRLYALRAALDLPPRASRAQVEEALSGRVLDQAELMGTYERRER